MQNSFSLYLCLRDNNKPIKVGGGGLGEEGEDERVRNAALSREHLMGGEMQPEGSGNSCFDPGPVL